MKSHVRCKACGYVTTENRIGDVCPACGLPKTVFEPYTPRVSASRRFWLHQHIHQVMVHFPQAFAMTLFGAFLFGRLVPVPLAGPVLAACIPPMVVLAPFAIAGGFVTGLWDGKKRFKKLTTPFLKIKSLLGILFFLFSLALAWLGTTQGMDTIHPVAGTAVTALMLACAFMLGKIGGWINCAATGGK